MSSNSIDFEIETLQKEMSGAINTLIDEKVGPLTVSKVRNCAQAIVDRYVENGILERRAIVDVNHREEISYFETIRDGFLRKAAEANVEEERINYESGANRISIRLNSLKAQTRDPNRLQVFLKEAYTYEPYDWTKYDF